MVEVIGEVDGLLLVSGNIRHDVPAVGHYILREPLRENGDNVGLLGECFRLFDASCNRCAVERFRVVFALYDIFGRSLRINLLFYQRII